MHILTLPARLTRLYDGDGVQTLRLTLQFSSKKICRCISILQYMNNFIYLQSVTIPKPISNGQL